VAKHSNSVLVGAGGYLPEHCVSNDELSKRVDTNDEWIRTRSGITRRHFAAEGETTSDLAVKAAQDALAHAKLGAEDIDGIIVATSTPDTTMPSTAAHVQAKLGISGCFAVDVSAACSGFVYALTMADAMLKAGQVNRILVIGAETMSRIVDWGDRSTCVLFGDGAGAWILERKESDFTLAPNMQPGLLAHEIYSDGALAPALNTSGGVSSTQTAGLLTMNGKEVFRHAIEKMTVATLACCERAGVAPQDIDWLIPHQANVRILSAVGDKLQLAPEKLIATLDVHANTSAASVPLAFNEGKKGGKFKRGQLIAMPVLGAGLVWGCSLLRL
jgi:3-oxoacyl-[acyl-carrier-protein] synthase-3